MAHFRLKDTPPPIKRPWGPLVTNRQPQTGQQRPQGIALVMALGVVMVLTMFMAEQFFASGVEMQALQTFSEAARAENVAKNALKAVEAGLGADEAMFMAEVNSIRRELALGPIPWEEEGDLVALSIQPLDHHFNINQLSGIRPGTAQDRMRWNLFANTMAQIPVPSSFGLEPQPLPMDQVAGIYGALVDWLDPDTELYTGIPGITGAEGSYYLSMQPEVMIKNGTLDLFSEMRLVRGVGQTGIPWVFWQLHFAALPRDNARNLFYPERLNINLASTEQVVAFLSNRFLDNPQNLEDAQAQAAQEQANQMASLAEEIAALLLPPEQERPIYNPTTLRAMLDRPEFPRTAAEVFVTQSDAYRVLITVQVGQTPARLMAVIQRGSNGFVVLEQTLNRGF